MRARFEPAEIGTPGSGYRVIRRRASLDQAERVRELVRQYRIQGLSIEQEPLRFYPQRELAAHLIGWSNENNQGVSGIEAAYDEAIRGEAGKVLVVFDRKRQTIESRVLKAPASGATLELTLDLRLQYIAERVLNEAIERHGAQGGVVVMLEPESGGILAMASSPNFNPNSRPDAPEAEQMRNRATRYTLEFGSCMKVLTMAAALEEHVVRFDEEFDVSQPIRIGNRPPINDFHSYSRLSGFDIVVKSSNIGTIKIAQRLRADRLERYFRAFGFGQHVSRDFPNEYTGIFYGSRLLSDRSAASTLASMAIGYEVEPTPLQMAAAVNVIATGGLLVEPRVVHAIIRDGHREEIQRNVVRRVVSAEVASRLTDALEQVVERGTARSARLSGYAMAAKTGTASKLVNGHYSPSLNNASVVGFVPSRHPVATILVSLDSPRVGGRMGGDTAGPVFRQLTEEVLRVYGVPPLTNPASPLLVSMPPTEDAVAATPIPTAIDPQPALAAATEDVMPDLTGLDARAAVHVLARLGLEASLSGVGVVAAQSIAPGAPVERGAECALVLARQRTVREAGASP